MNQLKSITTHIDKYPAHCNYDKDCCGIFDALKDGEMICNECGMTINQLLESIEGRNWR